MLRLFRVCSFQYMILSASFLTIQTRLAHIFSVTTRLSQRFLGEILSHHARQPLIPLSRHQDNAQRPEDGRRRIPWIN